MEHKMEGIEVGLHLGPFHIAGKWKPDESQKKAAWEMYVELVTRISIAELSEDEGLLREALTSLYSLFSATRIILKQYGPSVAKPHEDSDLSFGYLAVAILNGVLRPVLVRWHPRLQDYESTRPIGVSSFQHERAWEKNKELRQVINEVRITLIAYANVLAAVAEVPSLIVNPS